MKNLNLIVLLAIFAVGVYKPITANAGSIGSRGAVQSEPEIQRAVGMDN